MSETGKVNIQEAIAIHLISDKEGSPAHGWVHTHGLEKFGLPELEIRGLQTFLYGAAGGILNQVGEYMIELKGEGRSINLGESMQLGDKFCIFQFAKLPPIEGHEHHYEVERWCLVEPPGAHDFCESCKTGPLSHDHDEQACDCGQCGNHQMTEEEKMEVEFLDYVGVDIPYHAMEAIAAWALADPQAAFTLLIERLEEKEMATVTHISETEKEIRLTERVKEGIKDGKSKELVSEILDGWKHRPHVEAIRGEEFCEMSVSERVFKLVELFGETPF